ncbi:LOW QUALITY PROTEIN: hypothetical protein ColTof3_14810 [Colletotrichum tofieldiae]|nr:LOW QUALITY PROTEIN: hypothetical protein ColTof3_14810 [Colletotrichum tofieldiae]
MHAQQIVHLTFDDSFIPSLTVLFVLHIGHNSTVVCFHATLVDPDAELGDLCVVEDAVSLFCSAHSFLQWRRWPSVTVGRYGSWSDGPEQEVAQSSDALPAVIVGS